MVHGVIGHNAPQAMKGTAPTIKTGGSNLIESGTKVGIKVYLGTEVGELRLEAETDHKSLIMDTTPHLPNQNVYRLTNE